MTINPANGPAPAPVPPPPAAPPPAPAPPASGDLESPGVPRLPEALRYEALETAPALTAPTKSFEQWVLELGALSDEISTENAKQMLTMSKVDAERLLKDLENLLKKMVENWRKYDKAEAARKSGFILGIVMKVVVVVVMGAALAAMPATGGASVLAFKALMGLMLVGAATSLIGTAVNKNPATMESLLGSTKLGDAGGMVMGGAMSGNLASIVAGTCKACGTDDDEKLMIVSIVFTAVQMIAMAGAGAKLLSAAASNASGAAGTAGSAAAGTGGAAASTGSAASTAASAAGNAAGYSASELGRFAQALATLISSVLQGSESGFAIHTAGLEHDRATAEANLKWQEAVQEILKKLLKELNEIAIALQEASVEMKQGVAQLIHEVGRAMHQFAKFQPASTA